MMTMQLDTREFQGFLNQYLRQTRRSIPEAINKRAFFILRNTIRILKKSKAATIRQELNAPSRTTRTATVAEMIVNRDRRLKGEQPLTGRPLKDAGRRLIKKRIASIGFLKSFFAKAAKTLAAAFGRNFKDRGDWGRPNSQAQVATQGARVEAVFQSVAGDGESGPIVARALQQAFDEESRSIAAHVGSALDPRGSVARRLSSGTN